MHPKGLASSELLAPAGKSGFVSLEKAVSLLQWKHLLHKAGPRGDARAPAGLGLVPAARLRGRGRRCARSGFQPTLHRLSQSESALWIALLLPPSQPSTFIS